MSRVLRRSWPGTLSFSSRAIRLCAAAKLFSKALKEMLGQVNFQGSSDIQEIYVSGDLAYCWNHITVSVTPKSGGPATGRSGHALSILHKQSDGKWILTRDANLLGPGETTAA